MHTQIKLSRKQQWARKIAYLAIYPLLAIFILAMATLVLLSAWVIIPFGTFVKEGNEVKIKFDWEDQ